MTHRVLFNEGAQAVRHVPLDRHSRPTRVTSAMFSIVDLRDGETGSDRTIASGSATIGTVDTLLTAAAGPGQADPRRILVTSATGIVQARTYLLFAADGQRELVVVDRLDAGGLVVHGRTELRNDYTTTARLQDVEIAADFTEVEAAQEASLWNGGGPYQAVWEYTIDAQLYLVPETIWMTRTSVVPFVSEAEVLLAWPTLATRARHRASILDGIRAATEDFVAELEASSKDPADYRASNISKVAVRAKAIEYVLRWIGSGDADTAAADRHEEQYKRLVNQLVVGVPKVGTVTVDPSTNTATAGGDKLHGNAYIRRS